MSHLLTVLMATGLWGEFTEHPLDFDGLYTSAMVNVNGVKCRMLVDTCAPFSVIDVAFARTNKFRFEERYLKVFEEEGWASACRVSVSVGGASLRADEFAPMLRSLNSPRSKPKPQRTYQGILGNDFLVRYGSQIDLGKKVLRLRTVSFIGFRSEPVTEVPSSFWFPLPLPRRG
jgi:hypothetical protein